MYIYINLFLESTLIGFPVYFTMTPSGVSENFHIFFLKFWHTSPRIPTTFSQPPWNYRYHQQGGYKFFLDTPIFYQCSVLLNIEGKSRKQMATLMHRCLFCDFSDSEDFYPSSLCNINYVVIRILWKCLKLF